MKAFEPEERKWHLAAKLLTEGLLPDEQPEWELAMRDEAFRSKFEILRKNWHKLDALPYHHFDQERDWNLVVEKIRQHDFPKRQSGTSMFFRYAAAILFLLVSSALIWFLLLDQSKGGLLTTIQAPIGSRTFITLPDSSTVWLNAGSRIHYDQEFGMGNRDVTLQGEAYFDVKKNNLPFSVDASDFQITVLGTAFNIKAYPDEDVIMTTLLRGSLKVDRVTASGKPEEFHLQPSERLVLRGSRSDRPANQVVLEKRSDASADADWKDGWLTVRGESLDQLSKKIERLYNVKVRFEDESLKHYRYNGRIQQLSLEQVLNALALTSPVKFTINEKNVVLSENPETRSRYETEDP